MLKKYEYFQITKYEGPHTCLFTGLSRDHKHVSGRMIGILVQHIVEKDPGVKVEAIVAAVNDQFQYTVSYRKHGVESKRHWLIFMKNGSRLMLNYPTIWLHFNMQIPI